MCEKISEHKIDKKIKEKIDKIKRTPILGFY